MANKWIAHIKKTMKSMKSKGTYKKGMGLKQVIKEAKKHWKKGGAEAVSEPDEEVDAPVPMAPMAGRRTRRRHRGRSSRR